jgi:hypothetical protein
LELTFDNTDSYSHDARSDLSRETLSVEAPGRLASVSASGGRPVLVKSAAVADDEDVPLEDRKLADDPSFGDVHSAPPFCP